MLQNRHHLPALLLSAALLAATAAAAQTQTAPTSPPSAPETFGIDHASPLMPGALAAGQPTREQLEKLAKAGYKTVVDLRSPGEDRGFDEAAVARELGLAYVNVPVTPSTLDRAVLDRFVESLKKAERPLLVHCGTSNRVGALFYGYLLSEEKLPPEQALARAREAGLRSEELAGQVGELVRGGQ